MSKDASSFNIGPIRDGQSNTISMTLSVPEGTESMLKDGTRWSRTGRTKDNAIVCIKKAKDNVQAWDLTLIFAEDADIKIEN